MALGMHRYESALTVWLEATDVDMANALCDEVRALVGNAGAEVRSVTRPRLMKAKPGLSRYRLVLRLDFLAGSDMVADEVKDDLVAAANEVGYVSDVLIGPAP